MKPLRKAVLQFAARYTLRAIKKADGNVAAAARALGINRSSIYLVLQRGGVSILRPASRKAPTVNAHLLAFTVAPVQREVRH